MSFSSDQYISYEMNPPHRLARKPLPPGYLFSRNGSTTSDTITPNSQPQDDPAPNFSPSASLLSKSFNRDEKSSPTEFKPIIREVQWHHEPLWMIFLLLLGLVLALSHHFFYLSLNGKRAGSDRQQQWASAGGQIFAFSTITALRVAIVCAYGQYSWTVLRGSHYFKTGSVDKLLSLTSDLRGFFSWEVLRRATILWMLAAIAWFVYFKIWKTLADLMLGW
jgi:hypothetical protein